MSGNEKKFLIDCGRFWLANVWIGDNDKERDALILNMNGTFLAANLPVKVSRGWQPTDPVVRISGKCHSYKNCIDWASKQDDGGIEIACIFYNWYSTESTHLKDLPANLLALAIITHFAEVGRGYVSALDTHLYPWISRICSARNKSDASALWQDYKNSFPPSLTFKEDSSTDFVC